MIPLLKTRFERLALPLGLVGAAAALYNWRLWQRDKAFLAERADPDPLPPLAEWPNLPKVSVLVAAWNEAENIERHIRSFHSLRYPNKELVLCAGGKDQTFELAREYSGPQIKVLTQRAGEGKQRALARGFYETEGEIIFLTDADCELADQPFERTLWPVAAEGEQAATGSSRPYDEQLSDPFAFSQASTQTYNIMHGPKFAPGLLGRNCAIRHNILAAAGALEAQALTGTDYVQAKQLSAAGARIRQVPQSRMPTQYPETAGEYLRQQRRWLRNVALHGRRFRALDEVRASLTTSLVGTVMLLLLPAGVLISPWLLVIWFMLSSHALFSRVRYLNFTGILLRRAVRPTDLVWQPPLMLLDFFAWTQPLLDYVRQRDRWVW